MSELLTYAHPKVIDFFYKNRREHEGKFHAINNLRESAKKFGVDSDLLLHHFASYTKKRVQGLKDLPLDKRLETPGLDKMLYCDPEVVFPAYRAFMWYLFRDDKNPNEAADRLESDARERFYKYLGVYPSPEDSEGLPKPDKMPLGAKFRFVRRGLPHDMSKYWFVERLLQLLKEKHNRPYLKDRQKFLFEFLPHWWRRPSTFSKRISLSNLKRPDFSPDAPKSEQYDSILDTEQRKYRYGFEYGLPLYQLLRSEPFMLKQAYRQLYPAFARRTPKYQLALLLDRFIGGDRHKKLDQEIHAEVDAAAKNIDAYRTHFEGVYAERVRNRHKVGTFKDETK